MLFHELVSRRDDLVKGQRLPICRTHSNGIPLFRSILQCQAQYSRNNPPMDASRCTNLGDAGFKDMEMRIEIGPKPSMMRAMKSRSFAFQLPRPRGIPGALALGLIVVLVVGAVALLLLFSAAVVITGLAVSACAALYFAARRKLAGAFPKARQFEAAQPSTSMVVAREIEGEVLPRK